MLKTSLNIKLGQQLTLTPQLRLAIRLLQLSAVELETEINEALESNPLLDRTDDLETDSPEAADGTNTDPGRDDGRDQGPEADRLRGEAGGEQPTAPDPADGDLGQAPDTFDSDWSASGQGSAGGPNDYATDLASTTAAIEDLHDHLFWQLHLSTMSPCDRSIAVALIEGINDDGYLGESIESIQACLRPEFEVDEDEVLAVLHRVQRFDPVGVASRNLSECLCVQLSMLSPDTPGLEIAREIACGQLDALAKLGSERLAVQMRKPPDAFAEAVALLRSLDPRPGAQINTGTPEYIAPDCTAWREDGVWRVALAPGSQPRLSVNRHYEGLIGKASRGDASYLRGQLQEARWLIKSLETRADTLTRVATCIVRQQSGFLDHGPQAMRPLTLREVADEVGLHESTVSRATARKYLHTPRGTFEFRHFFASGVATGDGGAASSTAIQALIRKLIDAEDPRKPLSDAKLAAQLKIDGIPVARRTVAKYREAMNIPASNERQRLG